MCVGIMIIVVHRSNNSTSIIGHKLTAGATVLRKVSTEKASRVHTHTHTSNSMSEQGPQDVVV